jgi:hypothetical protein
MTNNTSTQAVTDPEEAKDTLATVDADGGAQTLSKEELTEFKDEINSIAKSGRYLVHSRRWAAERTRFAIWDGQSADGRKHRDANDGRPAFPFEGASDVRLRLADMIVNERVLVLTAAALRNLPRVMPLDSFNQPLGTKLTTLLKWVIKNQLGSQYLREIVKLAQYQEADSPAGAVLGIWWDQEWALELATLSLQQIEQVLSAPAAQGGYGLAPEQLAELDAHLQNPDKDGELAALLTVLVPTMSLKRAKIVVKSLREDGTAQFPRPYKRLDQPCLCAYRLYEDIFFPANTTDVRRRARLHLIREWVGEAELRERIVSEKYDPDFVTEALKHEAESAFPEYERHEVTGEWQPVSMTEMQELHKGEYEILTVLFRAVNEDNIPGIYTFPMSFHVEFAAKDRDLLEYAHGDYPLTWFGREILGNRLLDSRGVPELVSSDQNALKLHVDAFNDNVTLSTLPNIKVPRRRSKLSLVIKPLGIIKEDRPGDVTWMQPPLYPAGSEKQQELIKARVDEFFGRISPTVQPTLSQLHQQGLAQNFLVSLADGLKQLLQLCQQYMPDDVLAKITGDDGKPIAHNREEIQGQFNVELEFDPANLNMEYFKETLGLIVQIIGLDALSVTQRDQVIQWAFANISPSMGARWVRPVETAQQSEVDDETNNLVKIQNGIEPAMVAEGINAPLRLQTLQEKIQMNPDILQNLKRNPTNMAIFEARLKYLQNQVQQLKNAQIGRQVGQPALGNGPGMPGISGAMGN